MAITNGTIVVGDNRANALQGTCDTDGDLASKPSVYALDGLVDASGTLHYSYSACYVLHQFNYTETAQSGRQVLAPTLIGLLIGGGVCLLLLLLYLCRRPLPAPPTSPNKMSERSSMKNLAAGTRCAMPHCARALKPVGTGSSPFGRREPPLREVVSERTAPAGPHWCCQQVFRPV